MSKYIKDAEKVLNKAINLFLEDENNWEYITTVEGTKLVKQTISDIPCYLGSTIINKPIEKLINKVWKIDVNTAMKNDSTMTDCKIIESSNVHRVYSEYHKMTWPVWPRHVVYAQVKVEENNITYIVSYSINHSKVPLDTNNYVRSNVIMSVYEYVPIDKNITSVRRLTQIDPCGTIPKFIVDVFANKQIEKLNSWKHAD